MLVGHHNTLTIQMGLEASNVVQTLVEMAATSDPLSFFTTHTCTHLGPVPEHLHSNQQLLNQIVVCMQLAQMHKPELSEILSHLALALAIARCLCTHCYNHADDELDEVVFTLDKFIASSPP
jgi:hypothetical protein